MSYTTTSQHAKFFGCDRPIKTRPCDCAGCEGVGDYRAPKSPQRLHDYYWFCLEHVRDYNLNWNYYAGLNEHQVEALNRADSCWQRETWPLGGWRKAEQKAKEKIQREFFDEEDLSPPPDRPMSKHIPAAVVAALAVLELKPPMDFVRIKTHYKRLVKQHHPDTNGGSKMAEARLKEINQAFTALKVAYQELS
jgi:hypothetical protein